jgi:hypothetical protein
MATAFVAQDIVEVRIWSSDVGGQAAVNTVHYGVDSVGSPAATDQDLANILEANIATAWKATLWDSATFNGLQVRILARSPLPVGVFANAHAGVGTNGANGFPSQVAGLIQWQTRFTGRRFRGRIYMPFPATGNATSAGQPDNTQLALYVTAGNLLLAMTGLSVGGRTAALHLALAHKTNPVTATQIQSLTVSSKYGTQRKRGAFGRANSSPI